MTDDTDLLGLHRLRERIAGLEKAIEALSGPSPELAAYALGMADAEALVAPDYEAVDDAVEEPEPEPETPTLRNAPLPPHLHDMRGVVVAAPAIHAEPPQLPVWNEQRDAELLRRRAAGEDWPTIHAALTMMPGGAISSPEACSQRIYRLRASGDPRALPLRPQGIDEQDWAEALAMRRNRKGGREICEYFGWDLRRAGTICSALDRAIAEERAA